MEASSTINIGKASNSSEGSEIVGAQLIAETLKKQVRTINLKMKRDPKPQMHTNSSFS